MVFHTFHILDSVSRDDLQRACPGTRLWEACAGALAVSLLAGVPCAYRAVGRPSDKRRRREAAAAVGLLAFPAWLMWEAHKDCEGAGSKNSRAFKATVAAWGWAQAIALAVFSVATWRGQT